MQTLIQSFNDGDEKLDLTEENISHISSLHASEQHRLTKEGLSRSDAWNQAWVNIAYCIHPSDSDKIREFVMNFRAAQARAAKPRIDEAPKAMATERFILASGSVEPDDPGNPFRQKPSRTTYLEYLRIELANLQVGGPDRWLEFPDRKTARRAQSQLSDVAKMLGWKPSRNGNDQEKVFKSTVRNSKLYVKRLG